MFSWQDFLDRRQIAYTDRGASGDNVRITCPWCGTAETMSVSLANARWRCWKRPDEHYGNSPTRLVQALLRCTWREACTITGQAITHTGDMLSRVNDLLSPRVKPKNKPLQLPPEFMKFDKELPSSDLFYAYLEKRGFSRDDIRGFSEDYDLRYCLRGPFSGRIIFPVLFENEWVTWTGRTIYEAEQLRYKTLSADPERAKESGLPAAVKPITNYLLWYDELLAKTISFNTIVLVEGPFDALKVDMLGRRYGITATCFFTATPSLEQVELLHKLLPGFRHAILLLDRNTLSAALNTSWRLQQLGVHTCTLPQRFKDPGELRTIEDLSASLKLSC